MLLVPLPVIAHTFRVRLIWSNHLGVRPENVLNVECATGNEADIAEAFQDALTPAMFGVMSNGHTLDQVGITHLNGTSAEQFFTITAVGGQSSSQMIPAAAQVVSLRSFTRGSRGRGRVYVGPVCEGNQSDGVIDATTTANTQAAWDAFSAALFADSPQIVLVVASYKHATISTVQTISTEAVMGTQRRRQSQLR